MSGHAPVLLKTKERDDQNQTETKGGRTPLRISTGKEEGDNLGRDSREKEEDNLGRESRGEGRGDRDMRLLNRSLSLQDVMLIYLSMLATLVVILMASYQAGSAPGVKLPYHIPLDPKGDLQLSWNISNALQELYLELHVRDLHQGLIFGMSDRGELLNADLVVLWNDGHKSYFGFKNTPNQLYNALHIIGLVFGGELLNANLVVLWNDGHKSYFGDAWSDATGHVTLDSQQDYQLIEARYTPDGFYLLFKRPFSTCDPRDYVIEEGTVHLIYGVLDKPLTSLQQLNLSLIHSGVQRVLLLRPDTPSHLMPRDVQTLEVLVPSVTIPEQETTYWCHIYQLPHDLPKNHIVMYESVITPGNEAIVHHMEVFECAPQLDTVPQYSGSCDSKMKPKNLDYCRHVLAAWAMGAEAFYYPPDAGLPFGGKESSRFLRLEVHYHNPLLISGRQDSSGIRLYYTPTLRKYDAGIMELGLVYTPVMAIPPREQHFFLTGYCTAKCTQTALPPGGIHIFASQLHTHLAGRGVRTVLVRGGQEVEIVQEDKHFSTHYQIIRTLKKTVNVLPEVMFPDNYGFVSQGDVLLTSCTYNTEDRNKATVGGFGIEEEMCVNYVHYYPRTRLELCKSHVDPGYLQKYFSFINRFQGGDACSCGKTDVSEQFASLTWDTFSGEVLNSLYNTSPISMHCNQSTAKLFPGDWERQELPQVTARLWRAPYPCEKGRSAPALAGEPTEVLSP